MNVSLLGAAAASSLRDQPFTYTEVGQTRGIAPAGFHSFTRSAMLPLGADFGNAAQALLGWQVQARSGLQVAASPLTVEDGAVVVMRLGLGSFSLRIPCRIVYVVDEPLRQGFAYGTLPGHPESGEEAFTLSRDPDDRIRFTITAFSRPATRLARVGGPAGRVFQEFMTGRYLRALSR